MKYYVIGEREMVLAFRLVGLDGCAAENRQDVLAAFQRITGTGGTAAVERPNVLILTESAAALIEDEELSWQKTGLYPLIVEVPGLQGHVKGKKTLTQAIGEAIGVQV